MSNRGEVSAGNVESNPKAWDSSRSKTVQETTTVASSEITKHPSSDTRPASLEDATATTAPPRQSQMVGWLPVRNFRKNPSTAVASSACSSPGKTAQANNNSSGHHYCSSTDSSSSSSSK
ncbi:unnamed protein product [Sphagnum compactum]